MKISEYDEKEQDYWRCAARDSQNLLDRGSTACRDDGFTDETVYGTDRVSRVRKRISLLLHTSYFTLHTYIP